MGKNKTPMMGGTSALLGLVGLMLVQGILLGLWLNKDTRPPQWDPAVHLMSADHYLKAAAEGNIRGLLFTPTYPGHPPYPPAAHYVMAMGMSVARSFGVSAEDGATFSLQFLSLGVLAVGCFLVAGRFWGFAAGLSAAALAIFAPPVQALSHQALVDVALAAMVVLAYGCWVWSDGFSRLNWSLAFGVAAGIGCLVKWTFPSYLLPVVGGGIWGLLKGRHRSNILAALALSLVLAAPWYAANLFIVVPKLTRVAGLGAQEGDPSGRTLAGWLWYGRMLWTQWGGPLVLTSLVGLFWGCLRRKKEVLSLILWFMFSYSIWSSVSNKDPRYLLPAAMVIPIGVSSLPFGIPLLAAGICTSLAISALWAKPGGTWRDVPIIQYWPLAEMVEKAESLRVDRERPSTLVLISNDGYLNGNNLTWTVKSKRLENELTVRTKTDRLGEFTNFVIVKTGSLGPPGSVFRQTAAREEILAAGGWFQREFTESFHWILPDGSLAVLYVRNVSSRGGALPIAFMGWGGIVWEGGHVSSVPSARFSGAQRATLRARQMIFQSIVLRDVHLSLDGLRLTEDDQKRPRLLDLQEVTLESAVWTEADATTLLKKRASGLKDTSVTFEEEGLVRLSGRWGPVALMADLAVSLNKGTNEDQLIIHLVRLKLAGISMPRVCVEHFGVRAVPLGPTSRRPYGVRLSGLRVIPKEGSRPGALEVAF